MHLYIVNVKLSAHNDCVIDPHFCLWMSSGIKIRQHVYTAMISADSSQRKGQIGSKTDLTNLTNLTDQMNLYI